MHMHTYTYRYTPSSKSLELGPDLNLQSSLHDSEGAGRGERGGIETVFLEKPPPRRQQPWEGGANAALLAGVGDPGPGRAQWWAVHLRMPFTLPSICFPYLVPVEMVRKSTRCHFWESIILKAFSRRGLKILNHPPTYFSSPQGAPRQRPPGGWVMLLPGSPGVQGTCASPEETSRVEIP